jgi:hypothetical protein
MLRHMLRLKADPFYSHGYIARSLTPVSPLLVAHPRL